VPDNVTLTSVPSHVKEGHAEGVACEPADEDLMARYGDGDADAFDLLYERYRGPLYRYFLRHCEGEASAQELYQEAWLRVVGARERWRPAAGFAPWLFRIARNLLADHWRRRPPPAEPIDETVVDPAAPWPEAWTVLRDCVERLLRLLSGLAREQRDAFLLQAEGGLTLEQIAEVTGTGRETVKSRLRYALRRLRAGLEDCHD
jgi:RNA polymerase sigma-70 factor (ECF subfamily)